MNTRHEVSTRQGTRGTLSNAARRRRISLAVVGATALLALGLAAPVLGAEAQVDRAAALRSAKIVGVWMGRVTLRDCATGAPLGLPFSVLSSYHSDGTVIESAGTLAFAPNQRSEEHGVWKRVDEGVYRVRVIALMRFTTEAAPPVPGFLAGWQVIDYTVTLLDRNTSTFEADVEFYDTQGQLYRSGCSDGTSLRFE